MRRRTLKVFLSLFVLLIAVPAFSASQPIVSTDWLQQNLKAPDLIILDVRKVEDYKSGHIPGAVNAFYGAWASKKGDLLNELPADRDLQDAIRAAGIGPNSTVVVVSKADAMPERSDATRVAWTLAYAGAPNISLLDGGYNKWLGDKKPVSTDPVKPKPGAFTAKFDKNLILSKADVMSRLGKSLIVDVREPDFYNGVKKLDFVPKMGHIKGAVNLPTAQIYNPDGTFKSKEDLAKMAAPVVGQDLAREIILYCDTGKVATAWWFVLSRVLGYKDVKIYDGSMMEWAKDPNAPMEMGK